MAQRDLQSQIQQLQARGVSQREIAKRLGIPRTTLRRQMNAPTVPEVMTPGKPKGGPLPHRLAEVEDVLIDMARWWMQRQAAIAEPIGERVTTKRYTFHCEEDLIAMVQREADAERCSYSQIINMALRAYLSGRSRR